MASSERIFNLLDTKPDILLPEEPVVLTEVRGEIEFKNVSFAYQPNTPILKNINLSIKPGEKVAIVGATGAGKSTLINLLCRFYDVQEGEVEIDGVNVQDLDPDSLRSSLAVVLQDVEFLQTDQRSQ